MLRTWRLQSGENVHGDTLRVRIQGDSSGYFVVSCHLVRRWDQLWHAELTSVVAGCELCETFEQASEERRVLISDSPTDIIDWSATPLQAALCFLDTQVLDIRNGRIPGCFFWGFDVHPESVKAARENARKAGVADRITFEVANAKSYPCERFDLICFFDCLHDMGDPVGVARYAAEAIAEDGTVMLVEPFANDRVEENLTPVGRLYYAASTTLCCAHSLSEEVGLALGAQAGEARLADVFRKAGFCRFRRATETQFNLILEARR